MSSMKQMVVSVGIRVQLYERIRVVAKTEDIAPEELIDHILRSYIETWAEQGEGEEEDLDEDMEEDEEEPDDEDQ